MSAPTPAPGDDRPREGYYPDPSIPGYVRYWNGASWVPGTSRPAPSDGEPLAAPARPSVEETGPHFFDEDPAPDEPYSDRPDPGSSWGADRAHQSGFGGDQDRKVSWGAPQGPDPRVPAAQPSGQSASTEGTATIPPAGPEQDPGTFVFRRPTAGGSAAPDPGTMVFRPRTSPTDSASAASAGSTDTGADQGGPGGADGVGGAGAFGPQGTAGQAGAGGPAFGPQHASASGAGGFAPHTPAAGTAPSGTTPAKPGFGAGKAAVERAAAAQSAVPASGPQSAPAAQAAASTPAAQAPGSTPVAQASAGFPVAPAPSLPQQPAGPQAGTPMSAGHGGGQPSWAQQVHRLAGAGGDDQPVAPWKPPVEDPFQAAARRQAAARPAGLGKRLAARLVDTLVLAAVTSAAAVPLGAQAVEHVNDKIDAAKLTGETVTVWLLDGTTSAYLGIVLGVLLVFGIVYEALPTAKWGRTLGKKLFGLEVRDIEGHQPPTFGAALRRWLVYSVPGLLGVGVLGVLWCLFDRPWRQCWHDKAAHTFVAG
ncbi:RDD family protein [Streptomyces sp. A012304]|uniref:RDD family protein n=1 Tax=Streptomyces sp. A012304 TaxID=375446 RepID=UPI00223139C6|nr:RDD family protein [Streptomyces sp. A012304]GKQ37763.1 hypothetical protein ALMP_42990 [Streptomyces sp. A012304]